MLDLLCQICIVPAEAKGILHVRPSLPQPQSDFPSFPQVSDALHDGDSNGDGGARPRFRALLHDVSSGVDEGPPQSY
jgi:hypothetical protein